jgi:MoaA/NifB/PqqE/SkfB family radical SAM enzyme
MSENNLQFRINQFSNVQLTEFENEISTVSGTLISKTASICHHCHYHVPAYTYHVNNQLWLVKRCKTHGMSHHMIERDYNFFTSLIYTEDRLAKMNLQIITEVTDRCNIDCPHCYHMPDNDIKDTPIDQLIEKYKTWAPYGYVNLVLAGAEPTTRKDFPELVRAIKTNLPESKVIVLTNGIRFSDKELLQQSIDAGLDSICVGLNHPSYINNPTIRKKQLTGIQLASELGISVETISYTMSSVQELHDILEEILTMKWPSRFFRIRYGSDIGRYPNQERLYLSDTYKLVKDWCLQNNKEFKDLPGDNNLYHTMVLVDGKIIRLIQWCDETDINMEELKCGPYADFSSDGITNFLHSVIRRDVEKNQKIMLPDIVPINYRFR